MKNERELHKFGTESLLKNSDESGGNRKSSIYSRLFTTAVVEKELQIFGKFSPSQDFQLIPKIVYTPEDYKLIKRFINSAEGLSDVIIKNDQN